MTWTKLDGFGVSKANSGVKLTRNRVTSIRDANYFRVLCWMNKRYACVFNNFPRSSNVREMKKGKERKKGMGPLSGVKRSLSIWQLGCSILVQI